MDFYSKYRDFISNQYPSIAESAFKNEEWKNIIFPEVLYIPMEVLKHIKKTVAGIYQLKREDFYLNSLKDKTPDSVSILKHPQDAVLMSFDFHLDSKNIPRLIEVNTNSSGFLIGNSLFQYHGLEYKEALKDLIHSFQKEWENFKRKASSPPFRTGIIDEDPFSQKMIMEFIMYKDFFKTFDWNGVIYDLSQLKMDEQGYLKDQNGNRIDFCYNRSTDFYFTYNPHLKQIYKAGTCAFSPHPTEYFLLADKNRLCEWSLYKNEWPILTDIKESLLDSYKLSSECQDKIWKDRKKYVFKLTGKYGGKGVYRGKNLTTKTFQMLSENETVFQDYLPPPLWRDSKGNEWKFDLRAFSYGGNIQQITGRCYKGQLTNFKNLGGGFAPVIFTTDSNKLKNLRFSS